jgi:Flp pilus assembly CpaF family ATPase
MPVRPVIRETARRWLEGQLEELARAFHDRRYELGPVTACLRDPQIENVDVNGCDQKLADSPTPAQAPRTLLRNQNDEPTIQIMKMTE